MRWRRHSFLSARIKKKIQNYTIILIHSKYGCSMCVCGRRLAWSRISAFQAGDAGSNPADRTRTLLRITTSPSHHYSMMVMDNSARGSSNKGKGGTNNNSNSSSDSSNSNSSSKGSSNNSNTITSNSNSNNNSTLS